MAKKFLKQYEIFLKKAITDFRAAKNLLKDFEDGETELDLEIVFFHLQQSSEKLIKSILSKNEIDFPKVHDLNLLIKILDQNEIKLTLNIKPLIPLTDYAVEGRYAIIHDDLEDTDKYIKILDKFIILTKTTINYQTS